MNSKHPWTEAEVRQLGLHTDLPTAAQILGLGRSTAYDMVRQGDFPVPVLRLRNRIRVPVEPILNLLAGHQ